jgi:hypothetical protein
VLVDVVDLRITHLIVARGLFSRSLVMPVSMVDRISEKSILITANDQDLALLPRYRPRDESEVLAELKARLDGTPIDLSGVKATFSNGVLRLMEEVPDVVTKRQAEAIARSLAGVSEVENALTTDTLSWPISRRPFPLTIEPTWPSSGSSRSAVSSP